MFRKFTFAIVIFVVFLIALEGVARLIESSIHPGHRQLTAGGWQTTFFSELFDWHEPDPLLLWRFKANLDNALIKTNADHLIGDAISTHHRDALRVLVLGDSSPVGIGLDSYRQNFPSVLQRQLEMAFGAERPVEVINAAVSGYTSEQIRLYLSQRGWQYEPDYVVLYCGNNDASISGASTDREIMANQHLVELREGLSHLAIYRLLRAVLAVSAFADDETSTDLTMRVTPDRFSHNLKAIADDCAAHDCKLIICKPPVPMLWPAALQFKVFHQTTDLEGELLLPQRMRLLYDREIHYCVSRERFAALYGEGDLFTRAVYASALTGDYDPVEAVIQYREAVTTDSTSAFLWNNLGVAYWLVGNNDSALIALEAARNYYEKYPPIEFGLLRTTGSSPLLYNLGIALLSTESSGSSMLEVDSTLNGFEQLDSALQRDYFSLRVKRSYLEGIDSLSSIPNVIVVDLPELFRNGGGETLFIDHCHPTVKGHQLIAHAISRVIVEEPEAAT